MAQITLKGNPCQTHGELPTVGNPAPDFNLVGGDLSEQKLSGFSGKKIVLSILPSLDTPVCATSAKAFNEQLGQRGDTVVVNVSKDLPFAQKRFCESAQLEHISNLSAFRNQEFGTDYGVAIIDGPLQGLLARAIVVIDEQGTVAYTELVPEIAQEPNYQAAINALG